MNKLPNMSKPKREKINKLLSETELNRVVWVQGWVRTIRNSKKFSFIELNDGSTLKNLQIFADHEIIKEELLKEIHTGACIGVHGMLVASQGKNQNVEVQAREIKIYGLADPETYPLQKKGHSLEFLREIVHLRVRTNTFGAIYRLRHGMAYAIHQFFHQKGFFYVHTPIITGADTEGAGEMFQVTTLNLQNIPKTENGNVNFEEDFFGKPTHLTVSGQLNAELAALGLSEVYTFGPTFRAEKSNTPRHLAEFWMIEPEMAFYDLNDNMDLAEELLKYLTSFALENYFTDLQFLNDHYDNQLIERLKSVLNTSFVRLEYTDAIDILLNASKKFEFPVAWGLDLQSEHERYLVEEHFGKPVILINYPKDIKAFYMKMNDDEKTVRAMDVLFPKIGEIIGGSQREEDFTKLLRRIRELGLPEEKYWWYLDTRKFGTAPHSGFGLGFERLMLFITGMTNVRDVIPFPRTTKHAEF
jgi:asparaginyl-tRNA synthetase